MRKISKARPAAVAGYAIGVDLEDDRPRGVPGATVTSWPGAIDIDLGAILARPNGRGTIAGAAISGSTSRPGGSRHGKTVALSDGTRITFANAGPFDTAENG